MLVLADGESPVARLVSIVLLDLLLAGDNALVIALAVRLLPRREQWLGRLWGTFGAVALRIVFLAAASWLLTVPGVRLGGGLLLVWIAWKLLRPQPHGPLPPAAAGGEGGDAGSEARPGAAGQSLGEAIRIIVLADVSMSIDNVVAVSAAAGGRVGLAAGGIALSIPIVIWGSALIGRVLEAHPWIVWLGGGVLGHVAGCLLLEEPLLVQQWGATASPARHPLSLGLAVLLAAFGWWSSRRARP